MLIFSIPYPFQIIVGDAIAYMKDYIKEGKQFDYVFGDLTDVPISPTPRGQLWDFLRTILGLGMQCVKPGTGKYMTHVSMPIYCFCFLLLLLIDHDFMLMCCNGIVLIIFFADSQAIGIQCESALKMFEEQFEAQDIPVTLTRTSHFVPSFMECWCFYQATRKAS